MFFLIYGGYLVTVKFKKKTNKQLGRARVQTCLPVLKESEWVPCELPVGNPSGPVLDLTPFVSFSVA